MAACAFLSGCLSSGMKVAPPAAYLKKDGAAIQFTAISDGNASVTYNKKTYGPGGSAVVCDVGYAILNQGSAAVEKPNLKGLELAVMDKSGKLEFVDWTMPFEPSAGDFKSLLEAKQKPAEVLQPGKRVTGRMFFIHSKTSKPVAFTVNRMEWVLLVPEKDPSAKTAIAALEKAKAIELLPLLVKIEGHAMVSGFLASGGISLEDRNMNGLTVLYMAILAGNHDLIEGLVKDGADIHALVKYSTSGPIEPVHAALLQGDRKAVKILVDAGASLETPAKGGDHPGAIATREDNAEALRILAEYGCDVKNLKIPMAWSGAMDIAAYAKQKGRTKVLAFLESLP